jgi:CRISPR-associated endonuclease Csn1
MEIINSDRYTYKDELESKKKKLDKTLSEFTAKDLDDYYFSAPVKRMINRTLRLLDEIIGIMGYEPKKIFVEMTRGEDKDKKNAGRSTERSKALLELYKKLKDETRDWQSEIENAGESGMLKTKKLYLYYLQMGRCVYTGNPISLDELFTTKYDIDHIYPRQFVKDDNLGNNLVLVEKESNAYKSNNYPLEKMDPKVYSLWDRLHKSGLMNDEKYKRLISKEPLTDEQLAGFIARQLVETGQGTKGIADLLKQLMPNTSVIYVKGGNVSDFRRDYGFLKSRIVNNFHHAKDAYLNIVVGNVYDIKFTRSPMNFIKREYTMDKKANHYNLGKMFKWNIVRGEETAWIGHDDEKNGGSIETVREVMNKNTPLMTRMTYVNTGAFTKETLYNKDTAKPGVYFPQKSSDERLADVTKYGGYKDISTGYFCVVEHLDKKKRVRSIEAIPTYMVKKIEKDENELLNYLQQVVELKEVNIIHKKIGKMSLISKDGYNLYVSGKTGERLTLWNATNLCLSQENMTHIKRIENYMDKKGGLENITAEQNIELYETLVKKHTEEIFARRPASVGNILKDGVEKFRTLSLEDQCYTIYEILKSTAIASMTADLTMVGGSKNSGKMLISKNISADNNICIITQSITGIYEKTIDLLKI